VYLNISKTKLSVSKDLLPDHLYLGVKNEIKGIQDIYSKIHTEAKTNKLFHNLYDNIIQESYISYLSNYKNNIISFSKPQRISLSVTQEVYNKLYEKYIDIDPFSIEVEENVKSIERFRKEYIPTLDRYYNINYTVGKEILPGAILPLKFDLVGKNEVEVFAKSIDLERRRYNVEHDINSFYPIKDLSPLSTKFIVTKEPDKRFMTQHNIWKNLRDTSWLEYIDISEVERLEDYAKSHQVEPISKESN
ncbi:MAG: hypothetical protein AAF990_27150, partial [Bacteroidota bacterium]